MNTLVITQENSSSLTVSLDGKAPFSINVKPNMVANGDYVQLYFNVSGGYNLSYNIKASNITINGSTPTSAADAIDKITVLSAGFSQGSGGGGAIAVPDEYFFNTTTARDTYFTSNPGKLQESIYVVTNGILQQYRGGSWVDMSAIVRGSKGDKGDTGPQGPAGANGSNGVDGKSATLTIGTITTVNNDQPATVVNTGTVLNAVLDISLPKGKDGDAGAPGVQTQAIDVLSSDSKNQIKLGTDSKLYTAPQVQSDWSETDTNSAALIKNKPTIPTKVSQLANDSGYITTESVQSDWTQSDNTKTDYIKNKPTIPDAQIQTDWDQADNTKVDFLKNKPTIPSKVSELTNDELYIKAADVQTNQAQASWSQTDNTKVNFIVDKPTIPTKVSELTNDSGFLTGETVQSDWTEADTTATSFIKNKPTIPDEQIQSDWNQVAVASADFIKNKPTKLSEFTNDIVSEEDGNIVNLVNNKLYAEQTQANFSETDVDAYSYIQNKPIGQEYMSSDDENLLSSGSDNKISLTADRLVSPKIDNAVSVDTVNYGLFVAKANAQVQADYSQTTNTEPDYIKNKPTGDSFISTDANNILSAGSDNKIMLDGDDLVSSNVPNALSTDGNGKLFVEDLIEYRQLVDGTVQDLRFGDLAGTSIALETEASIGISVDANNRIEFITGKSVADAEVDTLTYDSATRELTITKGDESEVEVTLPQASSTADGLMTTADVATIADLSNKVQSLVEGGVWRATFDTYADMAAAYAGLDVTSTNWFMNDFVFVLQDENYDSTNKPETSYIVNVSGDPEVKTLAFRKVEQTPLSVPTATNTSLGATKGVATGDGKIYVESDGSMSLIGWDDLNTEVDAKADKVEDAVSGNFAGLDASGNLIDSGKKSADFATATSTINKVKLTQANGTTVDYTPSSTNDITLPAYPTSVGNLSKYNAFLENLDILDWVINVMDKVSGTVIVEAGANNTNIPEYWMKLEIDRRYADDSFITIRATGATGSVYINSFNGTTWLPEWIKLAKSIDNSPGNQIEVLVNGTDILAVCDAQALGIVKQYRGADIINAPYEAGNVWFQVHSHANNGWATIIAHTYADNTDGDYSMYIRHKTNDEWKNWEKVTVNSKLNSIAFDGGWKSVLTPLDFTNSAAVRAVPPGSYIFDKFASGWVNPPPFDNYGIFTFTGQINSDTTVYYQGYSGKTCTLTCMGNGNSGWVISAATTDNTAGTNIIWASNIGLGEDIFQIAASQELDTTKIYRITPALNGSNIAPNAPGAGDWLYTVKRINVDTYAFVTAESIANGSAVNEVWVAHLKAGTWSGWSKVLKDGDMPTLRNVVLVNGTDLKAYCDSITDYGTYVVSIYSNTGTPPIANQRWVCIVEVIGVGRYNIWATNNNNVSNESTYSFIGRCADTSTAISWERILSPSNTHNNAGQIKVNYSGVSTGGFVSGSPKAFSLITALASIAPSPITKYPYGSATNYTAMYNSSSSTLIENPVLGQVHKWRIIGTYSNKASGANGQLQFRLQNNSSGFIVTSESTLPSGLTSGNFTYEMTTIADSSSIANGYQLTALTSFSDSNLTVTIGSITRESLATELTYV